MPALKFEDSRTPSPPRIHPPLRPSDVLGVSAVVDALSNSAVRTVTESSVLGPFFTDGASDAQFDPRHRHLPSSAALSPFLVSRYYVHSPALRADRIEGEKRVRVCRGWCAHLKRRAHSGRGHQDVEDRRQG
jgi:hypothetical protein